MHSTLLATAPVPLDDPRHIKLVVPVVLLALFWCWETWRPFLGQRKGRIRHAGRNLAIALFNTVILGLVFGLVTATVAAWSEQHQHGLLNALGLDGPTRFVLALVLLDGWMYVWHRANHGIPFLWRFHRMHHSDRHMDVTTATRFHLGEHIGGAVLRLGLIPLLGFEIWNLVVYDTLVIAITQFHHADISIGRWDRWLRWLVVTPNMHKVHHSDWRPETDSNYSTLLSIWDRLARSLRMRSDPGTLVFGLSEYTDPRWQSWWGMMKTPFVIPGGQAGELSVPTQPKRVLFVCNENCNRSQMAEAFARIYGGGWIEASSAGCHPAGAVHSKAIAAMQEVGYDLTTHVPKGLSDLPPVEYDVAVVMCDDGCPGLKARRCETWMVPVPKEMPPEQFRAARDLIDEKVKDLLVRMSMPG
jgi:sterol desaturase/sphingolipid hydroxylase (fatty acid hydroxylase superfamily)/protein-tyrosine-phosphatase